VPHVRIEVLDRIPDDVRLQNQWDELVAHMESPEVFSTYEWALAVQRSYGSMLKPLLLLGYEGESLKGVAALAADNTSGAIEFLASNTADYCDFVSTPDHRTEWCDAILRELRQLQFSSVTLANLPADSATASVFSGKSRAQYRSFIRPAYKCARVVLGSPERRERLKETILRKKMLRRNFTALRKLEASVSHSFQSENLGSLIEDFATAHVARFLRRRRLSNLITRERRVFLYELARQLSSRGWLALSRLITNDRCIAWNYGFRFAGTWFWYQPTFDTSFEHVSPGFCLLCKLVLTAADDPNIAVVDLGLGAEDYKERFATECRKTLHVTLTSSRLTHARTVLRHYAAACAKKTPEVEAAVRSSRTVFRKLCRHVSERGALSSSRELVRRTCKGLLGGEDVLFFQWPPSAPAEALASELAVHQLTLDHLAAAAMTYPDDQDTQEYLLRAAQRLQCCDSEGYVVLGPQSKPVHFCWVRAFDGFVIAELKTILRAPQRDSVLLFDCWTPRAMRGNGYFGLTSVSVSNQLAATGKVPWIFAAAANHASLRAIVRAGFHYKFTQRRNMFGTRQVGYSGTVPIRSTMTGVLTRNS
jgi:CelD/BcsL family acetyltransferase involved in cellulose biosynthesis